jgi:hypothetical protein
MPITSVRSSWGIIGTVVWGIAVIAGMAAMMRYQMTPGGATAAPGRWPAHTSINRDTSRYTLVVTLHPYCPCSNASLSELALLMARAEDHVAARVIFVDPAAAPRGWAHSQLWRKAAAIPGVTVAADRDGRDARAFAATTSGDCLLYDAGGGLLFAGGITDGRGHEGDNAGLDSILAILRNTAPPARKTPVYGCQLAG